MMPKIHNTLAVIHKLDLTKKGKTKKLTEVPMNLTHANKIGSFEEGTNFFPFLF